MPEINKYIWKLICNGRRECRDWEIHITSGVLTIIQGLSNVWVHVVSIAVLMNAFERLLSCQLFHIKGKLSDDNQMDPTKGSIGIIAITIRGLLQQILLVFMFYLLQTCTGYWIGTGSFPQRWHNSRQPSYSFWFVCGFRSRKSEHLCCLTIKHFGYQMSILLSSLPMCMKRGRQHPMYI